MPGNPLFPIFLQLEQLQLLIIGGSNIGLEKLEAVLRNSPATTITVVAKEINDAIKALAIQHPGITLVQKLYESTDLDTADVVIVAVNDIPLATEIQKDARQRKLLINVADKPALCDFYLGAVVQKGDLKIAISTNGKSPTIAKRLKEILIEMLPDEIDELLTNMQTIRNSLNGDFAEKVKQLNELTQVLTSSQSTPTEGTSKL